MAMVTHVNADAQEPPNPAPNLLVNNYCNVCDADIDITTHGIQCYLCKLWFHAIGCGEEYVVASVSAFNNHLQPAMLKHKPYQNRFGSWKWICDFCESVDGRNNRVNTSSENDVEILKKKIEFMQSNFDDKFNDLKELIMGKLNNTAHTSSPTYASATNSGIKNSNSLQKTLIRCKETIVLTPKSTVNASTIKELEQEVATNLSNVQVDFVKSNSKGKVFVGFPNKEEKNRGELIISGNVSKVSEGRDDGYVLKSQDKMLPKLTVDRIPMSTVSHIESTDAIEKRNLQKAHIIECIKSKNPEVKNFIEAGHTVKVVYINHHSNSETLTVILKVSPAVRLSIMNKQSGRVFIGNSSFIVKDRYYVKVCYHCQEIGHVSNDCPSKEKNSCCLYCSGPHKSATCSDKKDDSKKKCARCSKSSIKRFADDSCSHNAASQDCPLLQREVTKIEGNTDLDSKNVL